MAQKTAISFLNTQVQTLSTTVANQGSGAVTAEQFSSLSTSVSTLTYLNFTNLSTYTSSLTGHFVTLSTYTSSLTGEVNSNSTSIGSFTSGFDDFSTAQTSINARLDGLSTYVSSFTLDVMSTSIQALQAFSTAQVSTFNQTMFGVSGQVSTLTSSFVNLSVNVDTMSTTLGFAVSTNVGQTTTLTTQAAQITDIITSTNLLNYGYRRGQWYYGPWIEFGSSTPGIPKWGNPNGTSAQGTSTIMSGNNMRGVTLINNLSTQDVTLPLYMGIATNGYNSVENMVPSTFADTMRFAHVGIPGSNSSITINLVSSGSATAAITLSAGEVVTFVYKGSGTGGASSPSNYYYIPSL